MTPVRDNICIWTCLITRLDKARDSCSSRRIDTCNMTPVRDNTYIYGHVWLHSYKSPETATPHGASINVTWFQFVTIYTYIWTCLITHLHNSRHNSRDCCFSWRIQTWLQFVTIHKYADMTYYAPRWFERLQSLLAHSYIWHNSDLR